MFFVSAQKHSDRLNTCKVCKYYVTDTKSCGTLIVGKTITYKGKRVKLCGCVMPIKAKLKVGSCPLDKWTSLIDKEHLEEIKQLVNEVGGTITAHQNHRITELWNIAAGDNRKVSNCNSCVNGMIEKLKLLIEQNENL